LAKGGKRKELLGRNQDRSGSRATEEKDWGYSTSFEKEGRGLRGKVKTRSLKRGGFRKLISKKKQRRVTISNSTKKVRERGGGVGDALREAT